MKDLKKLKLKDIVEAPMNVSEMGNLIAGIDGGDIMPAAYGCYSYACTNNQTESEQKCSDVKSICEARTCYHGA